MEKLNPIGKRNRRTIKKVDIQRRELRKVLIGCGCIQNRLGKTQAAKQAERRGIGWLREKAGGQ